MKYEFMKNHEGEFHIEKMARVLQVSRSGYYDWRDREPSRRGQNDERLLKEIRELYLGAKRVYGAKKITQKLNQRREKKVNHKRVERLMRGAGMYSKVVKKYAATTNSKHGEETAPNLLERNFAADRPNQKMVSDTTYLWTKEGWLYAAAIMDLCGRKIVGLAVSEKNDHQLVLAALEDAANRIGKKKLKGCILHSDRGSTYSSKAYREKMEENKMICSMSRKGDCWDNAPIESFWGKMKLEWLDEVCRTREEAKEKVYEYVFIFYNRQRPHASNGYLTPDAYCSAKSKSRPSGQ